MAGHICGAHSELQCSTWDYDQGPWVEPQQRHYFVPMLVLVPLFTNVSCKHLYSVPFLLYNRSAKGKCCTYKWNKMHEKNVIKMYNPERSSLPIKTLILRPNLRSIRDVHLSHFRKVLRVYFWIMRIGFCLVYVSYTCFIWKYKYLILIIYMAA